MTHGGPPRLQREPAGEAKVSKYSTKFTKDSMYAQFRLKAGSLLLDYRPKGADSIIEEFKVTLTNPLKLRLYHNLSPGDIVVFTAVIRDLHKAYPGLFVTDVRTSVQPLFENNPHITDHGTFTGSDVVHVQCQYSKGIANSNQGNKHFITAFHDDLERKLGMPIPVTAGRGEVFLEEKEKQWSSRVWEILEADPPFWIIDAGRKNDFTNKLWALDRFQAVVDAFPNTTFVQIGAAGANHHHPPLKGENVINEVGKTNIRQLIRLMYHAAGVITPVSFPMHLSAATPIHSKHRFKHRPTIVIAGSREPASWEAYTNHTYLDNCGILPCSGAGGCWKARIEALGDGDKKDKDLCTKPVKLATGQTIPKCMDLITAEQVISIMKQYMEYTY